MLRLCGRILSIQGKFFVSTTVKQKYGEILSKKQQTSLMSQRSVSLADPRSFEKEGKIQPMGWLLLTIPIISFGLGCWQTKRKAWKEQLIKDMDTLTKMPPVDLPEDLETLKDMEYRAVKVKGTFLHDKELIMGPRGLIRPDGVGTAGGLFSQRDSTNGYWVITPFKIAGRDDIVLINRGWVPKKNMKPETRQVGQIPNEIEMTCIVRKGEKRPQFTPEHKGDLFLYRDVSKMSSITGAQPVFLDANYESTVPGGPVGGQTRITLRNEHLSYLITWYGLSLATGYMWYRTILKRRPF